MELFNNEAPVQIIKEVREEVEQFALGLVTFDEMWANIERFLACESSQNENFSQCVEEPRSLAVFDR